MRRFARCALRVQLDVERQHSHQRLYAGANTERRFCRVDRLRVFRKCAISLDAQSRRPIFFSMTVSGARRRQRLKRALGAAASATRCRLRAE
jgi:hypothetical protein